ncbi:MAG TPA: CNP1-like family protein [Burkholderiales bacterium]|nr:CNP1-like family protein [Burkholderiales bacterium]
MLRLSLVLCLLLVSAASPAQIFKRDPGDEIVQPDEETLQLPPMPGESLFPFDPVFQTPLSFYIDLSSIRIGRTDRIARYTLVAKGDSGASNVSYEGLRCDTNERKIYAYGGRDGKWSPVREPQWKEVDKNKEAYRHTLFKDYFCPRGSIVGSEREAIDALKRGGHPKALTD